MGAPLRLAEPREEKNERGQPIEEPDVGEFRRRKKGQRTKSSRQNLPRSRLSPRCCPKNPKIGSPL